MPAKSYPTHAHYPTKWFSRLDRGVLKSLGTARRKVEETGSVH